MKVIFQKEYLHCRHWFVTIIAGIIGAGMFLDVLVSATIMLFFPQYIDRRIVFLCSLGMFCIFGFFEFLLMTKVLAAYFERNFDFDAKFM